MSTGRLWPFRLDCDCRRSEKQIVFKVSFTPSESGGEDENDQRRNDKHQRKFSPSLSLDVNGP